MARGRDRHPKRPLNYSEKWNAPAITDNLAEVLWFILVISGIEHGLEEHILKRIALMLVVATLAVIPNEEVQAADVKIHNIEYPSHIYGDGVVVVTVESSMDRVECVAYRDDVPVGSGDGYTTARIANVQILITKRSGKLTVKCF